MAVKKSKKKTKPATKRQVVDKIVHIAGRKTKMTQEVVNKLEYAFAIGSTATEACSFAEISREAFYNFCEKHPEFVDRIHDLKNKPVLKARQTLVRNLNNPLWAFKYLERRKPKEFGNNIKLTDGEGKPLTIEGQVVNNNLNLILENAEPETRKQFVELSRKLLASGNQGGNLPLQPASPD